jgi:hypothetical protein
MGAAFYFTPETLAVGKELGLNGFQFYFLGRGGVLGDVEPSVVQAAFGYFEPTLLAKTWNSGRAIVAPRDAAAAFIGAAADFGRRHIGKVADLEAFCAAAEEVIEAADPTGLSLFAAVGAAPREVDAPARAMQQVMVLRELRGSVHLLAVVASGVEPKVAHYLRRPDFFTTFGYSDAEVPDDAEEHRAALRRADELTDALLGPVYGVLDEAGQQALLGGLRGIEQALRPD